ncbi:MAG: UDP-3-O-[3-hydroxymyristoyl] glucosamine N-acyltransferase [Myxococcota bacterium]
MPTDCAETAPTTLPTSRAVTPAGVKVVVEIWRLRVSGTPENAAYAVKSYSFCDWGEGMIRCSFLAWIATGSVAFAADANGDGCQDEFAANGACVSVDATFDGTSTVGANASVLEDASIGPEVALGAGVVVAARASLAGRVAHSSNPLPIGANTVIGRGAQLGADHVLGDDVTVGRAAVAGARLTIATGGILGYAVQVGDDVNIGAGAVIGNLSTLGNFTTFGDNAVVARSVTIADGLNTGDGASISGIVGPNVFIAAGSRIEQGARIRKQADIGAGAAIEAGGRVGRGAVIAAGATVFGRVAANGTVGAGATVETGAAVLRGGEVCSGITLPTGSQVLGDGTWPAEGCAVNDSCQTIKVSVPGSVDGVYSIDPDGLGGEPAFDAYCDMTSEQGGFTLVMNLDTSDGHAMWWGNALWTNGSTYGVADANPFDGDFVSEAYSQLAGASEIRVVVHEQGVTRGFKRWNKPNTNALITSLNGADNTVLGSSVVSSDVGSLSSSEFLVRTTTTLYANHCVNGTCVTDSRGSPDGHRIGSNQAAPGNNNGGGIGNWSDMNFCCGVSSLAGHGCNGSTIRTASEAQGGWYMGYYGASGASHNTGTFGTDTFMPFNPTSANTSCSQANWAQTNGISYDYAIYVR